jgi:hypothetical protein
MEFPRGSRVLSGAKTGFSVVEKRLKKRGGIAPVKSFENISKKTAA